jgi:hypothetical protein
MPTDWLGALGNADAADIDELGVAVVHEAERRDLLSQVVKIVNAALSQSIPGQDDD